MKAKLKDGRILPIEEKSLIALNENGQTLEVTIEDIESFENSLFDWQQVRIQAAISAMQGTYCNSMFDNVDFKDVAKASVMQADALIEELKKNKNV